MSTPIIYLTSAGAVGCTRRGKAKPETAACVGPGRAFSIMRHPRPEYGELLDGRVLAFTPPTRLLAPALAAKDAGDLEAAWPAYEAGLRELWGPRSKKAAPGSLAYGRLVGGRRPPQLSVVQFWDGFEWEYVGEVEDGDTLACSCGAEAARAGRCHRVIAADLLRLAGWSVVLDGVGHSA